MVKTSGGYAPLIAFSTNGGLSFTGTSNVQKPPDAATSGVTDAIFSSVICSGPDCLAVGGYSTTSGDFIPMSSFSTNGGQSFTSVSNVTLPSDSANIGSRSAMFNSIICSGSNCLAVGSYIQLSGSRFPLVCFSSDGGHSFNCSSNITLPLDAVTGSPTLDSTFHGITCSGLNCIAVGSYTNTSFYTLPLLSFSTNGGHSFTSTSNVILPSDAQTSFVIAELNSIMCSGSNCKAVGDYLNLSGNKVPMSSFSTDGGHTFTSVSNVTLPNDTLDSSIFTSFVCSCSNCLAVGRYIRIGGGTFPLLGLSTNGGYAYTSNSNVTLPSNASSLFPNAFLGVTFPY